MSGHNGFRSAEEIRAANSLVNDKVVSMIECGYSRKFALTTAFRIAARWGLVEKMDELREAGADIYAGNLAGVTALSLAKAHGHGDAGVAIQIEKVIDMEKARVANCCPDKLEPMPALRINPNVGP